MKCVLLGKNGQLGRQLQQRLAQFDCELIALGREDSGLGCGDLTQPQALASTLRTLAPDVIINAAAYTAVDKAETEPELATVVNAEAVATVAQAAMELDALLLHYSTDYVFPGTGSQPWTEADTPQPLNHYGASKLAGEQAIQASGCRHLIFRTSWVISGHGNNFATTMARLMQQKSSLAVVNDQIGSPTSVGLIADVTATALSRCKQQPALAGIYHLTAAGSTSWFDFAQFIAQQLSAEGVKLSLSAGDMQAIPSSDYPTPAQRPLNSRLNCDKLQRQLGLTLPSWQDGAATVVADIAAQIKEQQHGL